jgi:hypothetical protein
MVGRDDLASEGRLIRREAGWFVIVKTPIRVRRKIVSPIRARSSLGMNSEKNLSKDIVVN